MTDDLRAVPVDRDNLNAILRLSTTPEQEQFVADNAASIAQGCFADGVTMCGLLWREEMVGFYSLVDPAKSSDDPAGFQPNCAYLWRFMIDHRFQGKDLGSRALAMIYQGAITDGFDGLSLTAVPDLPGCPVAFYQKQGFVLTGRVMVGEVELVRRAAA